MFSSLSLSIVQLLRLNATTVTAAFKDNNNITSFRQRRLQERLVLVKNKTCLLEIVNEFLCDLF